jgi:hypothetical protein
MKQLLFIGLLTFNFSAFGQIDTIAWEGKTVLVIVKTKQGSTHTDYYNKDFAKSWYLADSIQFVADSLVKRDLNDFGKDTVIIIWKTDWQKMYANKNCMPTKTPEDCMIWVLTQHFEFKNFQSNNWETYIFPLPNERLKPVQKFQKLISESAYIVNYDDKRFLVQNQSWTQDFRNWVGIMFHSPDIRFVISTDNEYADYDKNDAIYIYREQNPLSDYVEVIDLQTNRLIEKIKIE